VPVHGLIIDIVTGELKVLVDGYWTVQAFKAFLDRAYYAIQVNFTGIYARNLLRYNH
jgi:hypothetical protein